MRVCFVWWWFRWLFSFDYTIQEQNPYNKDEFYPCHRDRFPRIIWFFAEVIIILAVTDLISKGILLNVFLVLLGVTVFTVFVFGFVFIFKAVPWYVVTDSEVIETIGTYMAAKKQRICPFIEVEK